MKFNHFLCLTLALGAGLAGPARAQSPGADYSLFKLDAPDPVSPGADLAYSIEVSSEGPDDVVNLALTDLLPAGTTFRALTAPGGWTCSSPTVGATGTVTCGIANFPPGTAAFTLVVRVDPAAVLGSQIDNTGMVTADTVDLRPGDTTATALTTVLSPAEIFATKTVSVLEDRTVRYTIVLSNAGPNEQRDNPGDELRDVLPPELTLISASASSGATSSPAANIVAWNGSIPPLGSVTITVLAAIVPGTPAGQAVTNQGMVAFDRDGDGVSEVSGVTDDPAVADSREDPTIFLVPVLPAVPVPVPGIPALDGLGLSLLALLLAGAGAAALRSRT